MKNICLIIIPLLFLSCSKDNENSSRNSDPIIGSWYDESSGSTVRFQSNGRVTSQGSTEDPDETCELTFWSATEDNPDFNLVRRTYEIIFECDVNGSLESEYETVLALFSDDFDSVSINDFNGVRQ